MDNGGYWPARASSDRSSARSASTISSASALKVTLGAQPRSFLALEQSPTNKSTSVGRKYLGSTLTRTRLGSVDEIGVDAKDPNRVLVKVDPKYFRPTEVDLLVGDCSKAKKLLGWTPKVTFKALAEEMVDADLAELRREIAQEGQ